MGLKLVIERECSRDHQTALRQFLCCEPGGPEWAMDRQRYIRDLSVRKTEGDHAHASCRIRRYSPA